MLIISTKTSGAHLCEMSITVQYLAIWGDSILHAIYMYALFEFSCTGTTKLTLVANLFL